MDMNHPVPSADQTTPGLLEIYLTKSPFKKFPIVSDSIRYIFNILDLLFSQRLGTKVIEVNCGRPRRKESVLRRYGRYVVHKTILCEASRYFRKTLGQQSELASNLEALWAMNLDLKQYCRFSNEILPQGYTPSWVTLVEDLRKRGRVDHPGVAVLQQKSEVIHLPDVNPFLFQKFIHWLYSGVLLADDQEEPKEVVYTEIYCLAERLDVPELRMQCYRKLRKAYSGALPTRDVLEAIIKGCSSTATLRKYIVGLVSHALITRPLHEPYNPVLGLNEESLTELVVEIMKRVQSKEGSTDPNQEEDYMNDESDSEVGSSIDVSMSDMDDDSSRYMSDSENSEADSLFPDVAADPGIGQGSSGLDQSAQGKGIVEPAAIEAPDLTPRHPYDLRKRLRRRESAYETPPSKRAKSSP
jgi:hypothetical protein